MENILRSEHLNNGVRVEFIDRSNRYFGDYHRLRVEVRCRLTVTPAHFPGAIDPCAEAERARARLGDEITWSRFLERMGVAGGDLARTREEMIASFIHSGFAYLQSPEFPVRFVAREMAERQKPSRSFRLVK